MKLVNEQLIKKWEQLRLTAYKPTPNDVWTIGWGHTLGVTEGMVIDQNQAEQFFQQDVSEAENAVNQYVKVGLTQHQFDALVSFTFNEGVGAFRSSTLLRKLNAGDYQGAANEFPRWNKQGSKTLQGLVNRRADEMAYFLEADGAVALSSSADAPDPLKVLAKSKELWVGSGASVTGVASAASMLTAKAQIILSVGLCVALVGVGAFLIINRLQARKKGLR